CLGIISTEGDEITRSSHLGFSLFQKQLIALAIGVVIAIVVMLTDYRKVIITIAPFFYAFVMVMVVMVRFIGIKIHGNKAWLNVAGFSLQPSEFAKVATILMLARHLSQPREGP